MAIAAKLALPFLTHTTSNQPVLEHVLGGKISLFSAPAGYLNTEQLSGLLSAQPNSVIWLRTGPEDRDPATLLTSLASGIGQLYPEVGARTLETMRHQPGGIYGWAPLFAGLAHNLNEAAGHAPLSLVIQHVDELSDTPKNLGILWDHFLPLLPAATTRVLTNHNALPRGQVPAYVHQFTTRDLRLQDTAAVVRRLQAEGGLAENSVRRVMQLSEGRGELLEGVYHIAQLLGPGPTRRILDSSGSASELLARLARAVLASSPPEAAGQLALAQGLEYVSPELILAVSGALVDMPAGWMQALDGGWSRLRCIWREPVRAALRPYEPHNRELLERAAFYLIEQGDLEQAFPLLIQLGMFAEAAQVIVQVIGVLLDRGQWDTLSTWLGQLPETVRRDWPWLMYAEGEIANARGETRGARRTFAASTRLFHEQRDLKGTCQSLLAESCLAAWQDEIPQALGYAQHALKIAEAPGLTWYEGWACWQIGCLHISNNQVEEALTALNRAAHAAAAIQDTQMIAFIGQAQHMAQMQVDIHQQVEQHMQAIEEAQQAEQEIATRLRYLINHPTDQAVGLLEEYGWSQTPMFLKMPQPEDPPASFSGARGLLNWLYDKLAHPNLSAPSAVSVEAEAPTGPLRGPLSGPRNGPLPPIPEQFAATRSDPAIPVTGDKPAAPPLAAEPPAAAPSPPHRVPVLALPLMEHPPLPAHIEAPPAHKPPPVHAPTLSAYLLGPFKVVLNEIAIETWPSGRARSVFAYLLAQRGRPVPRELIMEAFWPEAELDSARNNLNVAMYSLRQTIKAVFDRPVVLFHENAYQISPDLNLWLDFAAFEQYVASGRKLEGSNISAAISEYERAISLYQGDFQAENLYEDWPALDRERLRVLYMETLDRLSLLFFNQGQYATAAGLCQRMLAHDTCREDAHCRLMRCYVRQGQSHLAIRQYQVCLDALQSELDVPPSAATVQLYEQIRRREQV